MHGTNYMFFADMINTNNSFFKKIIFNHSHEISLLIKQRENIFLEEDYSFTEFIKVLCCNTI